MLEWCTGSENMIHAVNNNLTTTFGITHHSAKLSIENVVKIRELYKNGNKKVHIAKMYNVSDSVINSIVIGRTWKSVK